MTADPALAPDADLEARLLALVHTQGLAVLATQGEGQPYSSLVAFAVSGGLRELLFATSRTTRKYQNLAAEPRVSLLVDNRANRATDFQDAMAATAVGRATEVADSDRAALRATYLARHPDLAGFLAAPTCALLRVRVDAYIVVQRFQEVRVFEPPP